MFVAGCFLCPEWGVGMCGQGSFGRVFLGKWRETTVAIKLLSQSMFSSAHAGGAGDADDGGMMAAAQRWHPCARRAPCPDLLQCRPLSSIWQGCYRAVQGPSVPEFMVLSL